MSRILSEEIINLITALHQKQIIAYPTESVFGLGCDPDSVTAIKALLKLKKRSWEKGFILVAAHYSQLKKYVDDDMLDFVTRQKIFSSWPGPVTWVLPASKALSPLLTGRYTSLAVRVSAFGPIKQLCLAFGKPIISTSANLTGYQPARDVNGVYKQLGANFLVMNEEVEGRLNPSEIRDALSGKLIRYG
ncbi:Sua5/YciO/YrdC/YwlC family protein [Sodalis sp. CWE]|uniref:Sua5/YciO/YrdC/YwlC family protein n=1 Tax=Sodalis sp. CWE TaxID=2803816 RepID=UPI001C7D56D4|nr:Sua5/YciO/YrdC/YwlC family protein [Sodalis sp. CWE]MBX4180857.1 Sua5/YciO/YrdC/YwlC family protein [Sodalis sp. CWE]